MEHSNYLFVDLETGGLEPEQHAILQIAAVITNFNFKVQGYFMTYVRPHPELKLTDEALAINQINMDDLLSAPDEIRVAHALHHFALINGRPARFAGYNCKFDLLFLNQLWERHEKIAPPYAVPWLDIHAVAKNKLELNQSTLLNMKLTSVASHLEIDTNGAHNAGTDLMITIEVAKKLKDMPYRNGAANLETARFS